MPVWERQLGELLTDFIHLGASLDHVVAILALLFFLGLLLELLFSGNYRDASLGERFTNRAERCLGGLGDVQLLVKEVAPVDGGLDGAFLGLVVKGFLVIFVAERLERHGARQGLGRVRER